MLLLKLLLLLVRSLLDRRLTHFKRVGARLQMTQVAFERGALIEMSHNGVELRLHVAVRIDVAHSEWHRRAKVVCPHRLSRRANRNIKHRSGQWRSFDVASLRRT